MRVKAFHIFLFLIANLTFAQQPVTIQLTEKDGSPDIEFYDLLEDKKGFVWFAADKGLYRYDGKNFTNFTHPKKRGLSVFGLYQDDFGNVWCNNISGQFFFVQGNKLVLFTDLKDELKGQLPEFIVKNKELTAFSEKGIFKINTDTKKRILVKDKTTNSPYYRSPFLYDGRLYFSLTNQIKYIENDKINSVFAFNADQIEPKNNSFCNLGNHLLFTSLFNGVQHFYLKAKTSGNFREIKVPAQLSDKTIIRILKNDNLIWFCTNQGVIVCSWNNNTIEYQNTFLPNEYITKIVKDKNNNFWFSSLRNGIFVMPNIYIKKVQLPDNAKHISTMAVTGKYNLVFGTSEGIFGLLNTETYQNTILQLPSRSKIWQILYNPNFNSLFISQEAQSHIWNLNESKMYGIPYLTASKAMSIAKNNAILNASYDRASIMENPFTKSGSSSRNINSPITDFTNRSATIPITDIRKKRAYTCFYSTKTNTSYVGFVDDLIQFDANNKQTVIQYKKQPIFAIDMAETNDGTLWVSTFKDGILGIKNKTVFYNLTIQNGLLSNETGKLKSDGNQLWISSQKGLQVFDIKNSTFKSITKNDGLESYNISDIEIIGNQVYVSSNKGIFIVDKNKSFKTLQAPEIYFTGVNIHDKDVTLQDEYKLSHDKNAVKISFNCNGFQTAESITYQYRMIGLNDTWLSLEKGIDFVRYSSLPSGNFTFQVKAINSNGVQSSLISLEINIEAPFWQKWWFYLVAALTMFTLIWLYFRTRLKRLENEKQIMLEKAEIDKELVFSQLENLRSQMNPHFIFNALNSIQEYIITNEKETASTFLVKFSRLIRIYLEHSRESEVMLDEELKALYLYLELEKDRFEDVLEYSVDVSEEINPAITKIPSLFIQPYVENALKHGLLHKKENRKLDIIFSMNQKKDSLICSITDNGIGRIASEVLNGKRGHQHQSFATSANQKRVELINKTRTKKTSVAVEDLYDANQVSIGTKVIITIPL
ncbi:histidine kinase [Flavobacterium amniphilum]|uniref:sensor histidine kinase n=1 Tax=Flavobacterium amniphilum TaxID=1834035 RepID=UPI00202AAD23|nr:histidine kinase [Flavobacterium amniphilum]MCL9805821.1 histidine kinase [Flavobacterium amniphilum]MCL9806408.1 histidine kinase [Flavobacterium amniphilum]